MAKAQTRRNDQPKLAVGASPGQSGMKLFSGNAHPALAQRIAEYLGIELGRLTVTKFADGESRVVIEESARGNEIFLIQPTCRPTNDNCMELFIMLDAFRRASASRITVVMPYYGYARQDKKGQAARADYGEDDRRLHRKVWRPSGGRARSARRADSGLL